MQLFFQILVGIGFTIFSIGIFRLFFFIIDLVIDLICSLIVKINPNFKSLTFKGFINKLKVKFKKEQEK